MTKVLRYIRHFRPIQNQGVDRNFGSEHLTSYLAEGAAAEAAPKKVRDVRQLGMAYDEIRVVQSKRRMRDLLVPNSG